MDFATIITYLKKTKAKKKKLNNIFIDLKLYAANCFTKKSSWFL